MAKTYGRKVAAGIASAVFLAVMCGSSAYAASGPDGGGGEVRRIHTVRVTAAAPAEARQTDEGVFFTARPVALCPPGHVVTGGGIGDIPDEGVRIVGSDGPTDDGRGWKAVLGATEEGEMRAVTAICVRGTTSRG
ncbi:hypothetical protein RM572_00255 [Streptomyces sp. DSM 42041]|uniref:Uncharacterized protein n=1 Tax=Streptomyces hazeniae TaxID=3075538 RepID=A0ABU2NNI1_9ACTN|nr:hypothetical protein [Streptomyces sp. DSM 42041]MDT0377208.1 hypothetical protein [Streptomyces sp. DSM 42041]